MFIVYVCARARVMCVCVCIIYIHSQASLALRCVCVPGYFGDKLAEATVAIEHRAALLVEKEQMSVTEQVVDNMDRESKSELSDNVWLKQQVHGIVHVLSHLHSCKHINWCGSG